MSNVFKRPMFRRGGEVDGGIMTGVRQNYEDGTPALPSERLKAAAEPYMTPGIDPIYQLLIQGGLRGMSQTGGGGTLGNLAMAFEQPTAQLFKDIGDRRAAQRDIALRGFELDINADIENEKNKLKQLEIEAIKAEGDADRQNRINVEIQKGKNKISELEFVRDNPEADPAKKGVIPSPITEKIELTSTYAESDNLELVKNPDFHAGKIVYFERNAPDEALAKFKGIVDYTYGTRAGEIVRVVPGGSAGDIIYDPKTRQFEIFDRDGNTYRYDLATNSASE